MTYENKNLFLISRGREIQIKRLTDQMPRDGLLPGLQVCSCSLIWWQVSYLFIRALAYHEAYTLLTIGPS